MKLLEILKRISEGSIDYLKLNYLIETAQKIAYTYLKYRYKNLNRTLMAEDVTYNEMAVEAIAPLFERDDDGVFIRLSTAFRNWQPPIETEKQALFLLNRLISRSVEKYVADILKDSDPFFAKILRKINYLIDKNGYKKILILGTVYITENENDNVSHLPDSQFIRDLPAYLFTEEPDSIKAVFNHIGNHSDKARAIPLNAFILKLKNTLINTTGDREVSDVKNEIEIDSMMNLVMHTSLEKLRTSYLDKGKINTVEYDAIEKGLISLLNDLRDGGINTGLHTYLMDELPGLSFEAYKEKYQNIFEYLFKLLRKEITRHIENEPGN